MKKYPKITLRDAIRAATSSSSGIFSIISDDDDFDNIKELKRIKI